MNTILLKVLGSFLLLYSFIYADVFTEDEKLLSENIDQPVQEHDVKFIVETSLSTAKWDPGVSLIDGDQKLMDYKIEGLKLYSLKGKVNIFDSDVLTVEKYGTFSSSQSQRQLLENFQSDQSRDTALQGLNISVKAFLLLKYFYLRDFKYFDALEYQYNTYKFYGVGINIIETLFWFGSTNEGIAGEDYFPLSEQSTISFYTDFDEHRLYILQLANFIKFLPFESVRVGVYNTNWLRPVFLGNHNQDRVPIVHPAEFVSNGIILDFMFNIFNKLNIGVNFNYGLDNYINITNDSLKVDYFSYDAYCNYKQNIYTTKYYEVYIHTKAFLSDKKFSNIGYKLDSENVKGVSLGITCVF